MNSSHIHPEDLALFALQLLPPQEMDVMRSHLAECTSCRQELASLQGDLALLAFAAEAHAPAASSRDRLIQQVAREPRQSTIPGRVGAVAATLPEQRDTRSDLRDAFDGSSRDPFSGPDRVSRLDRDAGTERESGSERKNGPAGPHLLAVEQSPRPNLLLRTLPWAGWAVAAGLAVAVGQMSHERGQMSHERDMLRSDVASVNHQIAMLTEQTATARRLFETLNDPTAQRVTLTLSKQRPVPQGKATYDANRSALVFIANNLEPLEPQKTYQLWIIPANGDAPVSAGIFHPDEHGNASVLLPKLPVGVAAKAFGVTIENDGGSASPTMPIILAGAAGV